MIIVKTEMDPIIINSWFKVVCLVNFYSLVPIQLSKLHSVANPYFKLRKKSHLADETWR